MILDSLNNLEKYAPLNSFFPKVIEYLKKTDLNQIEAGTKIELQSEDIIVNCSKVGPNKKEKVKLEAHDKFIDIQIPLMGTEMMGYAPRKELPSLFYESERDITFFEQPADEYFVVKPGMFVIFFPQDCHAPGITEEVIKKVVVKIRI